MRQYSDTNIFKMATKMGHNCKLCTEPRMYTSRYCMMHTCCYRSCNEASTQGSDLCEDHRCACGAIKSSSATTCVREVCCICKARRTLIELPGIGNKTTFVPCRRCCK